MVNGNQQSELEGWGSEGVATLRQTRKLILRLQIDLQERDTVLPLAGTR